MSAPKIVNVAVGILMRPDGQVLLGQRPAGKPYEGWWEFPGGKQEPEESAEDALVRECAEELSVRVELLAEISGPHAQGWPLSEKAAMRVWTGTTADTPVVGTDHLAVRWVPSSDPDAVLALPWIPADLPIVRALLGQLAP